MSKGTNGCMYNCGDICTGECMKPMDNVMNETDIVWHYENFLDIQAMVDEKLIKENLNPSNTEHTKRIKEIITETVLEFKR